MNWSLCIAKTRFVPARAFDHPRLRSDAATPDGSSMKALRIEKTRHFVLFGSLLVLPFSQYIYNSEVTFCTLVLSFDDLVRGFVRFL